MLRPLTSRLYEHELSLGLQLFMSPLFWQRWSVAKEVGGRRTLTLRCEAVYSRTLLHSEKSVRLNLRTQPFQAQQPPANYLQNVANSGEHKLNWSLINLIELNLISQSIISIQPLIPFAHSLAQPPSKNEHTATSTSDHLTQAYRFFLCTVFQITFLLLAILL